MGNQIRAHGLYLYINKMSSRKYKCWLLFNVILSFDDLKISHYYCSLNSLLSIFFVWISLMVKIPVDLRYFLKLQRKDIATPADVQQMSFVLRITFLDIFFKGFICLLLPPHWSSLVQIWPLSVLLCFRGFSPDILPVQKHAYFVVNLNFPSSMSFTRMFSEEAGQAVATGLPVFPLAVGWGWSRSHIMQCPLTSNKIQSIPSTCLPAPALFCIICTLSIS